MSFSLEWTYWFGSTSPKQYIHRREVGGEVETIITWWTCCMQWTSVACACDNGRMHDEVGGNEKTEHGLLENHSHLDHPNNDHGQIVDNIHWNQTFCCHNFGTNKETSQANRLDCWACTPLWPDSTVSRRVPGESPYRFLWNTRSLESVLKHQKERTFHFRFASFQPPSIVSNKCHSNAFPFEQNQCVRVLH